MSTPHMPDEHNCKLVRVGNEREGKILLYGKSYINNDKLIELNIDFLQSSN